ncbi:hypothetical protein LOKG_00007 [Loktanella phage pCB2051-A]|uniref:Uncharacterized protein n=1 Tax=Loktanella phage pCB2051-A TaxID=754044 RepID=M4QSW8_9CAUD|nr:hypothetical protein LOKG_00007 [Loktanella phage pCB2051-A]AGH31444.1 hypothetical protein LOKG_00007 [Loktanella phage pCB2051-A]
MTRKSALMGRLLTTTKTDVLSNFTVQPHRSGKNLIIEEMQKKTPAKTKMVIKRAGHRT